MNLDETSASLWRLAVTLIVVEAAILMIDGDPSESAEYWDQTGNLPVTGPYHSRRFLAAYGVLKGAIIDDAGGLQSSIVRDRGGYIHWGLTRVPVEELRKFLHRRGMRYGFFALEEPESIFDTNAMVQRETKSGFLNSQHTFYAPELALAVSAWEAVTQNHSSKRSPKDNLREWIESNWQTVWTYSSAKAPSKEAVERIATLANWKPAGGAPKSGG